MQGVGGEHTLMRIHVGERDKFEGKLERTRVIRYWPDLPPEERTSGWSIATPGDAGRRRWRAGRVTADPPDGGTGRSLG